MKRVKGTQGVALMECINADMNYTDVGQLVWMLHEEGTMKAEELFMY